MRCVSFQSLDLALDRHNSFKKFVSIGIQSDGLSFPSCTVPALTIDQSVKFMHYLKTMASFSQVRVKRDCVLFYFYFLFLYFVFFLVFGTFSRF
jgi:hypothetical protein